MLALNPPSNVERFLEKPVQGQYEKIAQKWLQKTMDRGIEDYKGLALKWGRKDVSHASRGTLGYVEWYDNGALVNVPYPHTAYQLEVFLHELGHVWKGHTPKNSCNGKVTNCRPSNKEEYEAEQFAMEVLKQEGIPISDDMFTDAQDYVTSVLFDDLNDKLPISRAAVQFVQINDRLKYHDGWQDFLDDLEGAQMINPRNPHYLIHDRKNSETVMGQEFTTRDEAEHWVKRQNVAEGWRRFEVKAKSAWDYLMGNPARTPEQYRLAQAVLHGKVRTPTHMTKAVAREMIEKTPPHLRSLWSRYTTNQDEDWASFMPVEPPYNVPPPRPGTMDWRYRSNPEAEAAQVYEEFHGTPSEHYTDVSEREHYHANLAELGILTGLKFRTPDGRNDITLDFDCDECEGQSGNLFGFGKSKTSGSSRLMRGAFEAGYQGSGGYRGTQEFQEWLEKASRDETLTRGFKKKLKAEYMRGLHNWEKEGEVAQQLGHRRTKGSVTAARGAQFATAVARKNPYYVLEARTRDVGPYKAGDWHEFTRAYSTLPEAEQALRIWQTGPDARESEFRIVPRHANPSSEWMEHWGNVYRTYTVAWRRKKVKGRGEVVQYAVSKGRPHNVVKEFGEDLQGAIDYAQQRQSADDREYGFNPHKGPLGSAKDFVGQMGSGVTEGIDTFLTGNPWKTHDYELINEDTGETFEQRHMTMYQADSLNQAIERTDSPYHLVWVRSRGSSQRRNLTAAERAEFQQKVTTALAEQRAKEPPSWKPRPGPWAKYAETRDIHGHPFPTGLPMYKYYSKDAPQRRNPERETVLLCANESENQLYLVGGDQSVDLDNLEKQGVIPDHDSVILGECWAISYSTQKKFDDFDSLEYVHTFGPEKWQAHMPPDADLWEDAQPPKEDAFGCGVLPTLRYDVLNQTLHLDGGSYFITGKGIEE